MGNSVSLKGPQKIVTRLLSSCQSVADFNFMRCIQNSWLFYELSTINRFHTLRFKTKNPVVNIYNNMITSIWCYYTIAIWTGFHQVKWWNPPLLWMYLVVSIHWRHIVLHQHLRHLGQESTRFDLAMTAVELCRTKQVFQAFMTPIVL